MRLDRVLSEGEAVTALRRLGFVLQEAEYRPGLFEVSHPLIGGTRVFTLEQLTSFAEGATVIEAYLKQQASIGAAG
ncbi:MAG: hypothetical protein IVW57_08750 [Ktedonobacterales bacterium]|nr:hypothetical protein [Ktedonobacterales bacterium]